MGPEFLFTYISIGEKWPHSKGNGGKYSIHGSYKNGFHRISPPSSNFCGETHEEIHLYQDRSVTGASVTNGCQIHYLGVLLPLAGAGFWEFFGFRNLPFLDGGFNPSEKY